MGGDSKSGATPPDYWSNDDYREDGHFPVQTWQPFLAPNFFPLRVLIFTLANGFFFFIKLPRTLGLAKRWALGHISLFCTYISFIWGR